MQYFIDRLSYQNKYNFPIGYSDHSGSIYPPIAAISLGAKIVEVHVTFDKRMFGPDSTSSLTIDQVKNAVVGIRDIRESLNSKKVDKNKKSMKKIKNIFGKSIALKCDKDAGTIISLNDLESKKPSKKGIPTHKFMEILGKKIKRKMKKGTFLNYKDIQ